MAPIAKCRMLTSLNTIKKIMSVGPNKSAVVGFDKPTRKPHAPRAIHSINLLSFFASISCRVTHKLSIIPM